MSLLGEVSGQFPHQVDHFGRVVDYLDRHLVGAGGQVRVEAAGNLGDGALRDERIDKSIATGSGDVLVSESQPLEQVAIVGQGKLEL